MARFPVSCPQRSPLPVRFHGRSARSLNFGNRPESTQERKQPEVRKKVSRRGSLGVAHHRSRPSAGLLHYSASHEDSNIYLWLPGALIFSLFARIFRPLKSTCRQTIRALEHSKRRWQIVVMLLLAAFALFLVVGMGSL